MYFIIGEAHSGYQDNCNYPSKKRIKTGTWEKHKSTWEQKLIEYTIEHAINSTLIDKVFINTDDTSIKDIACQYECEFYERNQN